MTRALTKKFNAISKWRTEVAFALMWWLSRGKALLFCAVKMSSAPTFLVDLSKMWRHWVQKMLLSENWMRPSHQQIIGKGWIRTYDYVEKYFPGHNFPPFWDRNQSELDFSSNPFKACPHFCTSEQSHLFSFSGSNKSLFLGRDFLGLLEFTM